MRDGHARAVALADRERRTGHDPIDPERAAGPADERRLAGAELAFDQHDIARLQAAGEVRGERLGLGWITGLMAP